MSTVQATQNTNPQASLLASLNGSASATGDAKGTSSAQDRFLTLLVTQIKNQDPLNPMDNAQMTSQLAQISTVEGIEKLNQTLQALMGNATDSQALQAAALVGHGVLVAGSGLTLQEGASLGGVDLTEAADRVTVTIKDGNGLVVRTMELGAKAAGTHAFAWDGTSDSGAQAVDGAYTISVSAERGGTKVSASALELGIVSSVVRSGTGVSLNLGSLGVLGLNEVKQIL